MDTLLLIFPESETLYDRLKKMAAELNMPTELLALRAVAHYVGDYGLKELPKDFKAASMEEAWFAMGLMKRPENNFSRDREEEVCQSTTLRAPGSEQ